MSMTTPEMREQIAEIVDDALGVLVNAESPEAEEIARTEIIERILALLQPTESEGELVAPNGKALDVEVDPNDGAAVCQYFVAQAGPYQPGTPVVVMDEREARLLSARPPRTLKRCQQEES